MATSVHDVPMWKYGQKPCHRGNGSHVTKTGGLDYMYTGAKRSAILDWGKYHYI